MVAGGRADKAVESIGEVRSRSGQTAGPAGLYTRVNTAHDSLAQLGNSSAHPHGVTICRGRLALGARGTSGIPSGKPLGSASERQMGALAGVQERIVAAGRRCPVPPSAGPVMDLRNHLGAGGLSVAAAIGSHQALLPRADVSTRAMIGKPSPSGTGWQE
jgi:hypothetical protein